MQLLHPVPIFIITHDRVSVTEESIKSYALNIRDSYELVVHDTNSTFPGMQSYLKGLEENGVCVVRDSINDHKRVAYTISEYMSKSKSEFYVLTDPDIALDKTKPDILSFFAKLLIKFGKPVGTMLRIDDIPDYYPLKEWAHKKHYDQFWNKVPDHEDHKGSLVAIQHTPIDTTFQLIHRDMNPHNMVVPKEGVRVYAPYLARHLDWYLNPNELTADQAYYLDNASKTAHWGARYYWQENNQKKEICST
jgi:hypothetical protein